MRLFINQLGGLVILAAILLFFGYDEYLVSRGVSSEPQPITIDKLGSGVRAIHNKVDVLTNRELVNRLSK